jgi:peptidyl-dipeptidase Dcp
MKLSTLTTRFEKNLLADTNELAVVIDDVGNLGGLRSGRDLRGRRSRETAISRQILVTLVLPNRSSITSTPSRILPFGPGSWMPREPAAAANGANDKSRTGARDHPPACQRARLLGFSNHAAYVTADETAAKTPKRWLRCSVDSPR